MLINRVKPYGATLVKGGDYQAGADEAESRCNCTTLRKASRRISLLYDASLARSGLKTTQRAILAQIAGTELVTIGVVAEAIVMDAGALARALKPLERERLVEVRIDPRDRRNRLVAMTEAGSAKLGESDRLWESAQRSFERAFGPVESAALREVMRNLTSGRFFEIFQQALSEPEEKRAA